MERDSMLDGQETVQIAWGELRWEGARQYAGRTGNRANSLGKASLGGSETVDMFQCCYVSVLLIFVAVATGL